MRRFISVAFLVGVCMWLSMGAIWAQRDDETRKFEGRVQTLNHDNDTLTLLIRDQGPTLFSVDRDRLDEDARHRWHRLQPGDRVVLTAHFSHRTNAWRVTDIDLRHDHDDHHGDGDHHDDDNH